LRISDKDVQKDFDDHRIATLNRKPFFWLTQVIIYLNLMFMTETAIRDGKI
jgi:hypothetical protein